MIEFIPNCCKEAEATFSGKVVFKNMTLDEKYEMAEVLQKLNEEQGKVKALIKSFEYVSKFLLEVSLKNLETGNEYTSFDDMRHDSRNDEVCQELVAFVVQGYRVTKNLKA